jgi:CelD/BcsL family acetyltransferase involved in cellulose biosynthesis
MILIAHLRDQIEVQKLLPEWQGLWQRVAAATPFQSPEWLFPWWECFGNANPVVVTARKGGELIAVLPLYLLEDAGCRKLLPLGISLSDYIDALIDPDRLSLEGCSEKIERQLFSSLSPRRPGGEGRVRGAVDSVCGAAHLTLPGADAPGPLPLPPEGWRGALPPLTLITTQLLASLSGIPDWDELYIPDLRPSAALLAADCPIGLSEERADGEPCPVLSLPTSVEELREAVPRKTSRDLRQARRRAAERGEVTIACADAATLDEFVQEFFRLHEIRWQRLAEHGVCSDPTVKKFHLTAARRMLGVGMLRLYLLRLGNTPLAAYYGFTAKGTAYAYLSGFDPDYGELSPGAQVVGHAIEEAIREGAREFHFLRGGEPYKYAWGAVDWRNTSLCLRRRC